MALSTMVFNKSQKLIIGTIASAMLGFPDVGKVFTEEIINKILENPTLFWIVFVSIVKIGLAIGSIWWLVKLYENIKITYNTKPEDVFWNYVAKLALTGGITCIIVMLLKYLIGI